MIIETPALLGWLMLIFPGVMLLVGFIRWLWTNGEVSMRVLLVIGLIVLVALWLILANKLITGTWI